MQVPFHPLIAHFPLVIAFILPVLILIFAYMIKISKMTPRGWLVIVGLQLTLVITGYVALESGENEEHLVEKVVAKEFINAHENAAEVFVGSTVIALVISIAAFFLKKEFQIPVQLGVFAASILSCYFGYRAGNLGGELVYKHGAAQAYTGELHLPKETLLPQNKADAQEVEVHENESLKADETDYGDESELPDEDASKQED